MASTFAEDPSRAHSASIDSGDESDMEHERAREAWRQQRTAPNILITGTPGTGKTTTSEMVSMVTGLKHVEVGKLVCEKRLHDGYDEQFQSWNIDEDRVVDELEEMMAHGGIVVDHHGCDFFPERWFDLVVVLTCSNSVLYDRLEARGYSAKKIQENVQCEIMRVVADEAQSSYRSEVVMELASENVAEMEANVSRIESWVDEWHASQS